MCGGQPVHQSQFDTGYDQRVNCHLPHMSSDGAVSTLGQIADFASRLFRCRGQAVERLGLTLRQLEKEIVSGHW